MATKVKLKSGSQLEACMQIFKENPSCSFTSTQIADALNAKIQAGKLHAPRRRLVGYYYCSGVAPMLTVLLNRGLLVRRNISTNKALKFAYSLNERR